MKYNLSKKGSCLLRIHGISDNLTPAEKQIADYIEQNPEDVVSLTIEELAIRSKSSFATINRLCKKIGYSGIKELKSSLMYDVMNIRGVGGISDSLAIEADATIESTCEKVYTLAYKILEDSYTIMDTNVINEAVNLMLGADSIVFIGAGYSGISARYAYSKFFRIGLKCSYEPDSTLDHMHVSLLRKGDLLFAISSSGRTTNIVETAKMAKKNEVPVISLSDFAISPLTKVSDLNLYTTPRNVSMFMNVDMPLIVGQITIIDVLYMCCCSRMADKAVRNYEKTAATAISEKMK